MIFGNLESIATYKGISKNLDLAIDALIKDGLAFENVEIEVDGIRTVWGTAIPQTEKEKSEKAVYEAHRKFLDIHVVLKGEEVQGYAPISAAKPTTEYDDEKDCIFLEAEGTELVLHEGDFAIYFPCDAHAPARACKGLTKTVIKIRI